jgi:hypothetical protein
MPKTQRLVRLFVLLAGLWVLMAPRGEAIPRWCPYSLEQECYDSHDQPPETRINHFQCQWWDEWYQCCMGYCFFDHYSYVEYPEGWWYDWTDVEVMTWYDCHCAPW